MKTIGFDLDMTLVDSMESIRKTLIEVLNKYKIKIDNEILDQSIGLPVKESLKIWVPENHIEAYKLYKDIYQNSGYRHSRILEGADNLLNELIGKNFEVIVITAKNETSAQKQLNHLNLPFTRIFGEVFGFQKTEVMKFTNCIEYVGDHIEDYKSAVAANVKFIGVNTNPHQNLLLESNGCFPVMNTLNEFWVYSHSQNISS